MVSIVLLLVLHVFNISVTVKTVLPDVAPVYLDGAVLPQTTAKNVEST